MVAVLRAWRGIFWVSLLLVVMAAAGRGYAAQPPAADVANEFMTKLATQAIGTLRNASVTPEQRETAFNKLLADAFDLDAIGRFVIGRHYQQMTAEQRDEYHRLFASFLIKTYARRLSGYSGEAFTVVSARAVDEQHVVVRSRIQRAGGQPLDCDWRLRAGENGFRIIDLTVEGVSMAVAQRQDFAAVLSGNGVDGLLAALRARTDHLPATASR
jgi:phospholipid transport system substrate-binding protein